MPNKTALHKHLPENTYLSGASDGDIINTEASINTFQIHRAQEAAAIQFFAPFNAEFNNIYNLIANEEWNILGPELGGEYRNTLSQFWGLNQLPLNNRQLNILLRIIPLASNLAGKFDALSYCFTSVLEADVELTLNEYHRVIPLETDTRVGLGNMLLGVNSLVDNVAWEEEPAILIKVGPLNKTQIEDWLKGEDGMLLPVLNCLEYYFLPALYNTVVEIIPEEPILTSELNQDKIEQPILGYTLRI